MLLFDFSLLYAASFGLSWEGEATLVLASGALVEGAPSADLSSEGLSDL